jgi:hypothetical protein
MWHIINHRDYIDGPFDTYEEALQEARYLGKETRVEPRVSRRTADFYVTNRPTIAKSIGSRNIGSAPRTGPGPGRAPGNFPAAHFLSTLRHAPQPLIGCGI